MKKGWVLMAAAAFLLLMLPMAYANSLVRHPLDLEIAVDDYSGIRSIAFWGSIDGKVYEYVSEASYPETTGRHNERIVRFDCRENDKSFKLQVNLLNGETMESNPVEVQLRGVYIYNMQSNMLKPREGISRFLNKSGFISALVLLGAPLVVTLLVEWLTSLAFRLKPGTHVLTINFLTNLFMNILILIIFKHSFLDYYLIVLLLEIIVAIVEFSFYKRKYKQYTKQRLLLFTVVANLASWGVYEMFGNIRLY